jgi:hypothetical protein
MRLYGGRFINNGMRKQIYTARELFDGIVMSVNESEHYCLVRIQGTQTQIKAWYPENTEAKPHFLKTGNAVRIHKPGGTRSRMEVLSHGMFVPTTNTGEDILPADPILEDTVITGCGLMPCDPPSMYVLVQSGTYRIANEQYSFVGLRMDNNNIEMDNFDLLIDEATDIIKIDAASATHFRYDSLVLGADGYIDVIKGTNFLPTSTIPSPPTAPENHLRVGFVLIYPKCTALGTGNINKYYSAPVATRLSLAADVISLDWDTLTTTLRAAVLDQYNNPIACPYDSGWQITISWSRGNGSLTYGGNTVTQPIPLLITHMTATTMNITYTRNKTVDDISPDFTIDEISGKFISQMSNIMLYDQDDYPMV